MMTRYFKVSCIKFDNLCHFLESTACSVKKINLGGFRSLETSLVVIQTHKLL